MKVLKRSEQRNFSVNTAVYTNEQLKQMFNDGVISLLFDHYVVYCSDCKEVKVVYNKEYGFYENVVVTNCDIVISIWL